MPAPKRTPGPALIEQLLSQPHRFEFVQAVRLLEWGWRRSGAPGSRDDLLSARVRLRNSLSLAFPASEIESLRVLGANDPGPGGAGPAPEAPPGLPVRVEITPAFMGLLGALGSLPSHYTEQIALRESLHKDRAARAFLDIFQQRAVTLFYKAWFKHRLPERYGLDQELEFLPQVLALVGLGPASLRHRLDDDPCGAVRDESLAYFSGLLHQRSTSTAQMQAMLSAHFGVSVAVQPFVGRWSELPADARSSLGLGSCRLGADVLLGGRVWQRDLRVGLRIGPLDRRQYLDFLPGRHASRALERVLRLVTGVEFEYEVRLVLRATDVRPARLAQGAHGGAALGLDAFLLSQPCADDRQDTRYTLLAA